MQMRKRWPRGLLALTLSLSAACVQSAPSFGDYQAKGFISDYSRIKPEGGDSKAYRYRNPRADVSQYKKLMIDRIKIWFKEGHPSFPGLHFFLVLNHRLSTQSWMCCLPNLLGPRCGQEYISIRCMGTKI